MISECDHDWEYFESDGYKQCIYTECQEEQELTEQDYEDLLLDDQNVGLEEYLKTR